MILKLYSNPKGAGWRGWLETPGGKAIAFIRLDGEVVWDW